MELMITVFKTEIIECLLKIDESKETHMVVSFVEYDRIDLLKIVYSATDAFLKITDVIDQAARNGSLECLEYLSEMGACCTTDAMDDASSNGHLDIVKWLHINRKEGCTTKAMDEAALRGI